MYIHEAIQKAQEAPSIIRRPDFGKFFVLVPKQRHYFLYAGTDGSPKVVVGWEPMAEDLLADDWEVTKAEGIEWPAEAPTPAQRSWTHFLRDFADSMQGRRQSTRLCRRSRRRGKVWNQCGGG